MKKHFQVVIVGGGSAGMMVAAQLIKREASLKVAIIDPSDKHFFQPLWPLVSADVFDIDYTQKAMSEVIPNGVTWIKAHTKYFLPERNSISIDNNEQIYYDYLVVCPGIKIAPELVEGLTECMNKGVVCSNYNDPEFTRKVIDDFEGGTALFTQPATPIKCSGAPQQTMYLADALFKKKGIKKKTKIIYAIPSGSVFAVKEVKDNLMKVVDRKDINVRFFHKLVKVDGVKKIAWYEILKNQSGAPENSDKQIKDYINSSIQYNYKDVKIIQDGNLIGIHFDMMYLAPPQSAPDFIRNSPLSNELGWVAVNQNTLQHLMFENIFSLGDVAYLPTAKTYAAITKQAPVVVDGILQLMRNINFLPRKYDGYSSCQIATDKGKLIWAEFDYSKRFTPNPSLKKVFQIKDSSKKHRRLWLLKKYLMPYLYWNKALKGIEIWKN
ncbi:MAG TPA: NAD(P)/FAD-dependent oxidoreductase [Saprospiraceae bacterium]|nr:NAD(P)/FAD-dependent oxidoreductase [Saprospiraceae bacterium]